MFFDVFLFLGGFLFSSSRTQVTTVGSLGDDGATNHHCQHRHGDQISPNNYVDFLKITFFNAQTLLPPLKFGVGELQSAKICSELIEGGRLHSFHKGESENEMLEEEKVKLYWRK